MIDVSLLSLCPVTALHPLLCLDLTLPFFGQMDNYLYTPQGHFTQTNLLQLLTTGPTLGTAPGTP